MMEFENPFAFFLLLLVPLLYFLRYLKLFRGITFPLTLSDWHGASFDWRQGGFGFLSVLARVLAVCAYACAVTAYAGPVVRHQQKVYSSRGADIVFVVDTSPSMAAKDIGGMTRLDAAKQAIRLLADSDGGDSFGLVEMARDAAVSVPPTMDRNVFFDKIDKLVVGGLGDGTAIGTGLSCALFHLERSGSERRCIVLITDGENNAGSISPYTAARLVREKQVSLYVLGIGTRGSVPLEYVDPKTGRMYSGYLKSEYDSQTLSKIASEADGKFFTVESLNALAHAFDSVARNESVAQSYRVRNYDTGYYGAFLLAAACFACLAWVIRRVLLQEVL
ncbi:MAG TPA: hypothetical protein DDW78_00815 [Treponema sp.]|nr:hypothetical protein [Treponema sp.]